MSYRVRSILAGLALAASGCVWHGTPVPVSGDLAALAGRWSGEYASAATGRSGSIIFELVAGTDSAYGDVLMTPDYQGDVRTGGSAPGARPAPRSPAPLRIAFVRSEGGVVTGALAPYPDPESGLRLRTTFQGRLVSGEFRGTYTVWTEGNDRPASGEWSVGRVKE